MCTFNPPFFLPSFLGFLRTPFQYIAEQTDGGGINNK